MTTTEHRLQQADILVKMHRDEARRVLNCTAEHMRLSYATSMENIEKAMDRIGEALGRID